VGGHLPVALTIFSFLRPVLFVFFFGGGGARKAYPAKLAMSIGVSTMYDFDIVHFTFSV
jgi:hypothetical protein